MDDIRDHGRRLAHKLHPARTLRCQLPRPRRDTATEVQPIVMLHTPPATSSGGTRTALACISAALIATVAVVVACTTSSPTPTAAPTPTPAPTAKPEPSPTATTEATSAPMPTATAIPSPTATATTTPSATATATQTPIPTPTATATTIPTPSTTPTPIPTLTPTPVPTQTPTPVPTPTPTPTQTPTPAPTATPTPSPTPTATPIPLPSIEEQRAALAAFYATTNGDNWTNNEGWLSDRPLDQWHGVYADSRGNVTELRLPQNNLSGPIPADIVQLASLDVLDLWGNQLTGNIPPALGQLTALTLLSLNTNRLSGTIPAEIGNLTQLNTLDLSYNELTGNIPKTLGNLTVLARLYLGANKLIGKIPEELGNISTLEEVHIDDSFEGCIPDPWRDVGDTNFDQLNLDYCGSKSDKDDRAVLVKLYNATDGDNWRNSDNWLSDRPIGAWKGVETDAQGKVTHLDLRINNLNGKIPIQMAELTALRVLDLSINNISGPIPQGIGRLTNLEKLELAGNMLSGTVPAKLADLANLVNLTLTSNKLTGEFPTWVGGLRRLESLNLGDNQLTGDFTSFADDLDPLKDLSAMSIAGNSFSGCLPATLRDIEETDFLFSELSYCDEPPKQPPVTPEFIKWVVGDAVRPVEERAARLGVQWLFEYAESIGWPIVGDDITVYFMTLEPLVYASTNEDGVIDEGEIESQREFISGIGGFAREDSNFNRATEVGDFINRSRLFGRAEILIHENIHTAFQRDINGLYTNPSLIPGRSVFGPAWFTEGMASYFGALITSRNGGETDFLCRGDCELTINGVPVEEIPLASAEDVGTCEYACGAFAIELLASIVGQRHIVDFYTLQRLDRTWQETFEDVYGISVPDFYALYEQHRIAGFPELNPPIVPETGR